MERISKGSKRLCMAGAVPFDNWLERIALDLELGNGLVIKTERVGGLEQESINWLIE
jgi:hypothetical protein